MDVDRVDQIIQFALLVAGDIGANRGELGPIHLLKYAYLGDLTHATTNQGSTWTGADWEFYRFGPWEAAIHGRIETAVSAIRGQKRTFDWGGDTDGIRYCARDNAKLHELELILPARVTSAIRKVVRDYDSDTYALLDYVYRTPPMVHAAPNARLDFSTAVREPAPSYRAAPQLTERQRKKVRSKVQDMQERMRAHLDSDLRSDTGLSDAGPVPRYDDVYRAGQEWMDELAGEQIAPEGELEFDADIWESDGRHEPDIP